MHSTQSITSEREIFYYQQELPCRANGLVCGVN